MEKTIRVYSEGELVAETIVILSFVDWLLIMPETFSPNTTYTPVESQSGISGDTLHISAGCDIDSIVVSWSTVTGVIDKL